MLELAVIGSGPCALALVARLACTDQADNSLDFFYGFDSATEPLADTMQRLAALKKTSATHTLVGRVKVFDSSGSWMGKWNGLFGSLGIRHLRSPHVAHPCPTHALALLAHAEALPQDEKLHAFADFKTLRFHGCHRSPSSALFRSLCDHLVGALKLNALLETATVVAVEPVFAAGADYTKRVDHFRLTLQRGDDPQATEVIEAKRVVVATGSTSCPRLPEWMEELREQPPAHAPHSLRHAWELPEDLAPQMGQRPLYPQERVLVVGGGLTAVQLAVLAAANGCREVCLAARRPLRVQQFDFGAEWGDRKARPRLLRSFLAAGFEERLGTLQEARGVSSVPPEAHAVLRDVEEMGLLKALEWTEVAAASPPVWDAQAGCWRVVLETYDPIIRRTLRTERRFERIWCATGSDVRLQHHPLLGPFYYDCPIQTCGGLPCLTPHLAWAEHCELYVLGAPASLVLGPDGANLMGARTGAARAAHVLGTALAAAAAAAAGSEDEAAQTEIDARVARAKQEIAALEFRYDSKRQYVKGAALSSADNDKNNDNGGGGSKPAAVRTRRGRVVANRRGCGCGC